MAGSSESGVAVVIGSRQGPGRALRTTQGAEVKSNRKPVARGTRRHAAVPRRGCHSPRNNTVMVATDIAARGIHVDGIDLVIHAD